MATGYAAERNRIFGVDGERGRTGGPSTWAMPEDEAACPRELHPSDDKELRQSLTASAIVG
jgi:hypothetical protein